MQLIGDYCSKRLGGEATHNKTQLSDNDICKWVEPRVSIANYILTSGINLLLRCFQIRPLQKQKTLIN